MHMKIYGGKHCFYTVYTTSHTHFLSKSDKVWILQNDEISTKFRPKFKISTKFRQNLVKIRPPTPENPREMSRAHRNLRSRTSFLPNLHDCVAQKFYKNLQKFQILQNLEILVDTVFLTGFSRLKNNV